MRSQSITRSSGKKILIVAVSVIVLAILAIGSVVCIKLSKKPYVAVYLTTGDIYYGRLSLFPKYRLYDAWFLQRSQDGSLGLQKFADAFWKPIGPINIDDDKVVFWTEIESTSPIAEAIEKKQLPESMKTKAPAAQNSQGDMVVPDQANPSENTQP
ncbi:MAG: hypothetical protein PHG66_02450 [Candidatus Colwellbacteria bacterium]|nr:hypothetical protein [Candidatus Colwellbacteria bacterium]